MKLVISVPVGAPFPLRKRIGARIVDFGLKVGGIRFTTDVIEDCDDEADS